MRNNELYKHYMINEIDKPTYNSLKKDIEEKINQTNTKIDNTKNDIITLSNGFVWYDWVNDFNKIIDVDLYEKSNNFSFYYNQY